MFVHSDLITVKKIKGKGRGVFARSFIPGQTIIERVPVVLMPIKNIVNGFRHPDLARFFFMWSEDTVAIALGYGSLYNHSYHPNASYEHEPGACMIYRSLRDIHQGEEICINYNGDPKDKADVGFKVLE